MKDICGAFVLCVDENYCNLNLLLCHVQKLLEKSLENGTSEGISAKGAL